MKTIRFLHDSAEPSYEVLFRHKGGRFVSRKQDWFGISEIFLNNEYAPVIDCIQGERSPVVVDLGANIGAFALYIFENYPAAKVVSVEAAPDTYDVLLRNQKLNPNLDWKVIQAAVWDQNGDIVLERHSSSTGHRVSEKTTEGESVPSKRLGTLLSDENIDNIDLLKIDIEGAESAVIPDDESLFSKTKVLLIEIHNDRIDPIPVYNILARSFTHCWKTQGRSAQKPVYVLAHEDLHVADSKPVSLSDFLTTR